MDSSGNIYVSDTSNHRVMKWGTTYSDGGTLVAGVTGSAGSGTNQLYNPRGLDVDSSGNIYIADYQRHRIMKWASGASAGTLVAGVSGSYSSGTNNLYYPFGVDVDASGNIYVADYSNHRIQRFQVAPQITIAAGETTGTLTIAGIADSTDEVDKTITLTPATAENATLTSTTALNLALTDNDDPPVVTFALSNPRIEENSSTDVTLTATLSLASDKAIVIPYTIGGTATITDEYTITASPINIAAGATTGTVTISTNGKNDTDIEIIETIKLTKCYFFIIV